MHILLVLVSPLFEHEFLNELHKLGIMEDLSRGPHFFHLLEHRVWNIKLYLWLFEMQRFLDQIAQLKVFLALQVIEVLLRFEAPRKPFNRLLVHGVLDDQVVE